MVETEIPNPVDKKEFHQDTKSLKEVKEELQKTFSEKEYRNELLRKMFRERAKLRRTYAVLLVLSPARFGEINEKVFISRNALYSHLYQLIELGLIRKVSIMDLWNKEIDNPGNKEIIKKFKDWTSKMRDGQVQYFAAKTNYFVLTDLGKDKDVINWVLKLEQELKK